MDKNWVPVYSGRQVTKSIGSTLEGVRWNIETLSTSWLTLSWGGRYYEWKEMILYWGESSVSGIGSIKLKTLSSEVQTRDISRKYRV